MTVFKYYFHLFKKHFSAIMIYFILTLVITIITGMVNKKSVNDEDAKPALYIIDKDETEFSNNLSKYIYSFSKKEDLETDTEEKIKDAIFSDVIDYALVIPKGFSENIDVMKLKSYYMPNSSASKLVDMKINKYINYYKTYTKRGFTDKETFENLAKDFEIKVKVGLIDNSKKDAILGISYFNMLNYTILGSSLIIFSFITGSYFEKMQRRRQKVSALSMRSINIQIVMGHIIIMLIMWAFYSGISFFIVPGIMMTKTGLLLLLNSLVFSIFSMSLGFLLGHLTNNNDARSGITNVLALGSSFLCGAFIPQEILGDNLTKYTRFLPSYWFVSNNERIGYAINFTPKLMIEIFQPMIMLIVVSTFVFFIINKVSKYKMKEE